MTDLELGRWQSQSSFLGPMPPLGTSQEEQAQRFKGGASHPLPSSPPPSFTVASAGAPVVPPGLLVLAREDREQPGVLHVLPWGPSTALPTGPPSPQPDSGVDPGEGAAPGRPAGRAAACSQQMVPIKVK